MNFGTAVVLVIVIVIVALAVRALVKKKGHSCCGGGDESSCGCNCSGCEGKAQIYGINVDANGNAMDSSKESCPHCSSCK